MVQYFDSGVDIRPLAKASGVVPGTFWPKYCPVIVVLWFSCWPIPNVDRHKKNDSINKSFIDRYLIDLTRSLLILYAPNRYSIIGMKFSDSNAGIVIVKFN